MTISSAVARADYPGTGSTGPFAFTFKLIAASDLVVTKRSSAGVETTLTLTTDYAVSGVGNSAGGSVTLTTALASGEHLTLRRVPSVTQPTDIRNNGTYFPATIEDALDRLVMIDTQHEDAIARSLKLMPTEDPSGYDLTLPAPDAGQVLAADPTGTGLEWRTLTDTDVALPGGGRTVSSLSDFLSNDFGTWYHVHDFGASPSASATVNTAAINAAAAAAGESGLLVFGSGCTYDTNGTVTILGPCLARGARLSYTGTGTAMQVGDGTNLVQQATIELPEVVRASKTGLGWSGSDTGVKLLRVFNCYVRIPYVRNFAVGVNPYGLSEGCDYNTIQIGHLSNNQVNFKVGADASGWANENLILGGRMSHDLGELQSPHTTTTGQPGVRHVQFVKPTVEILNNWRFYGTSLEGDVPEYHVDVQAENVVFRDCRWEAAHPKARFDGASAVYNEIRGGYNAKAIVLTHSNGASQTTWESAIGVRSNLAPGDAVYALTNNDSSATPILVGLAAGQDPHTATLSSAYAWALSANFLKGKQTADVTPRLTLDFTTGTGMFSALGVGGSSAATTPGSVVKKLPVYAQDGTTLLGYLPIYSAIT